MNYFQNAHEIIEFAINAEQEAVDFYITLQESSDNLRMKEVFRSFAEEEMKHKVRLVNIRDMSLFELPAENIRDLKIGDYMVDVVPSADMNYADALILAMKKEKKAFSLYLMLSERIQDPVLRDIFLGLAQEESKHKLRFELEYDEFVLKEN